MIYLLCFIGPVTLALATALRGPFLVLPTVVLFGLIPALDQLLPQDHDNTPGSPWLRWLPFAFVPAHLATLGGALWTVGSLSPIEQVALVISTGFSGATAINVAHELMHRPGKVEQRLAEVLMASTSYTHFCIEHVQGHHKYVGTPRDAATARAGESLYAFLPRTLVGGLRSAWAIEVARGGSNRMIAYAVAQVVILAAISATLGPVGLAAFLGQSLVAILMLETINYLEHYGLSRAETAPGRYERVRPEHSWNSSHRVSNGVLLNLARHSDHHAYAARPFRELRHYDAVPQLPAGYSAMLILATIPPLWFRVMDARLARARVAGLTTA